MEVFAPIIDAAATWLLLDVALRVAWNVVGMGAVVCLIVAAAVYVPKGLRAVFADVKPKK